jgi:hypothetical protein
MAACPTPPPRFYKLGPAAATATTVSVTLETLQLAARLINRDANPSGETYACAPLAGADCLVTVLSAAGLNLRTLVGMGVSWAELVESFGLRAAHLSHPACMWLDPGSLHRMRLSTQTASGTGVSLDRLIMDVPDLTPAILIRARTDRGVGTTSGMLAQLHGVDPLGPHCETPARCLIHRGLTGDEFASAPYTAMEWQLVLGLGGADITRGLCLTRENLVTMTTE